MHAPEALSADGAVEDHGCSAVFPQLHIGRSHSRAGRCKDMVKRLQLRLIWHWVVTLACFR